MGTTAAPNRSTNKANGRRSGIEWRSAELISVFAAADYTAMSDSSALVSGKGGVRVAL